MRNLYRPITVSEGAGKDKHRTVWQAGKAHPELKKNRASGHRGPNRCTTKGWHSARAMSNRKMVGSTRLCRNKNMGAQQAARLKIGGNIKDPRRILHTRFGDLGGSVGVATTGVASQARDDKLVGARGRRQARGSGPVATTRN